MSVGRDRLWPSDSDLAQGIGEGCGLGFEVKVGVVSSTIPDTSTVALAANLHHGCEL